MSNYTINWKKHFDKVVKQINDWRVNCCCHGDELCWGCIFDTEEQNYNKETVKTNSVGHEIISKKLIKRFNEYKTFLDVLRTEYDICFRSIWFRLWRIKTIGALQNDEDGNWYVDTLS